MLLTAALRYLKPLFSSALMGVEMSFALWRRSSRGQITSFSVDEAEGGRTGGWEVGRGGRRCSHPSGGEESPAARDFLPVVAHVSGEYEWALNMNEAPSSSPTRNIKELHFLRACLFLRSVTWPFGDYGERSLSSVAFCGRIDEAVKTAANVIGSFLLMITRVWLCYRWGDTKGDVNRYLSYRKKNRSRVLKTKPGNLRRS